MLKGWSCSSSGDAAAVRGRDKFTFFSFEFEFIATGGRLAKVPNGNLGEDDPLIKGPSLQYGHTAGASVQHQTVQCNALQWSDKFALWSHLCCNAAGPMHFLLTVFCCAEARKRKGTEDGLQTFEPNLIFIFTTLNSFQTPNSMRSTGFLVHALKYRRFPSPHTMTSSVNWRI